MKLCDMSLVVLVEILKVFLSRQDFLLRLPINVNEHRTDVIYNIYYYSNEYFRA